MTAGQLRVASRRAPFKRAVAPEDKSERREAILRAAEGLLRRAPAGEFSVDQLARAAKLAKGTLYLYFRTREEVLLAVHHARLQRMFDALEQALSGAQAGALSAARAVVRFLRENPAFLPLAVNCRGMIEANVSAEAALAFKTALGERLAILGGRIEALSAGQIAPGQGLALLMNSYALMLGLWQLADPPGCLRGRMQCPGVERLQIDYETQLEAALLSLWDGTLIRSGAAK